MFAGMESRLQAVKTMDSGWLKETPTPMENTCISPAESRDSIEISPHANRSSLTPQPSITRRDAARSLASRWSFGMLESLLFALLASLARKWLQHHQRFHAES